MSETDTQNKILFQTVAPFLLIFLMSAVIAQQFVTSFIFNYMVTSTHVFLFVFVSSVILSYGGSKVLKLFRNRSAPRNEA